MRRFLILHTAEEKNINKNVPPYRDKNLQARGTNWLRKIILKNLLWYNLLLFVPSTTTLSFFKFQLHGQQLGQKPCRNRKMCHSGRVPQNEIALGHLLQIIDLLHIL